MQLYGILQKSLVYFANHLYLTRKKCVEYENTEEIRLKETSGRKIQNTEMKGDKFRFRDYQATLEVVCEKGSRDNYGLLNWTVAQETDDLVYYHSYTHEVRQGIELALQIHFCGKYIINNLFRGRDNLHFK